MTLSFEISPREALAAPTDMSQAYAQSIIILIASIMSLLGAGWIILSFVCFKNLRSFRHQLILGLAMSDFLMAFNFLSSTSMNISGRYIGAPQQKQFCQFNGFITQVFVIQTDYWVLVIAICTYFILADHKKLSSWFQDHRILLSSFPWVLSVVWAAIGLGVTGYGNIGAWCWFTSDEVRLLVNFVPRWLIIVVMLIMYARLCFVLYHAHNRFVFLGLSHSNGQSSGSRALHLAAPMGSQPNPHLINNSGNAPSVGRAAPETSKKLKRLARLMMLYPVAYMLVWTLPTVIRIYQTVTRHAAPFSLQTIDKSCIVLQGFVDAIIYGVTETSLSSWRNLLFPSPFPLINGMDGSSSRDRPRRKRLYGIPSSRLEESSMPGDSTTSLEIAISATDSQTRIREASAGVDGWSTSDKEPALELGMLTPVKAHAG